MVIQRWQSLLLLIAVVLMCIFCATPYAQISAADATAEPTGIFVYEAPVFLIINIVIAIVLFLAIFMYKNLKRQMTVTLISIVLICASMATCGFILYSTMPDAELIWTGGVLLLVIALVCALAAYRFMGKDRKLLRSYDRLR
ncbi:MAG: DUF4293 domain-containing protein [Muribaculaceae bacterium]|nr:DUF4293 domain-containing protein [Muribaculaceae bacterium]